MHQNGKHHLCILVEYKIREAGPKNTLSPMQALSVQRSCNLCFHAVEDEGCVTQTLETPDESAACRLVRMMLGYMAATSRW